MKQVLALAIVLLLAALAYWTAPQSPAQRAPTSSPTAPPAATPSGPVASTCSEARVKNGWCAAHQVGYVGSLEVRSQLVFDALDLHGHDVDVPGLACASCREAARTDGFCSACNRGFLAGRAYLS